MDPKKAVTKTVLILIEGIVLISGVLMMFGATSSNVGAVLVFGGAAAIFWTWNFIDVEKTTALEKLYDARAEAGEGGGARPY